MLTVFDTHHPSSKLPGRASGYPASPPTDPDVSNLLIRFLGNQSIGTTLAHNFAALETLSDAVEDPGPWKRICQQHPFELLP